MNSSRLLLALSLFAFAFAGAGCDSLGDSVAARFKPTPIVRTFEADREHTFRAAVAALKVMNYRVRRSRAREGILDAEGTIHADGGFQSSRQFVLHIQIEPTPDGRSNVEVEVRELVEEKTNLDSMIRSERVIPESAPHVRFYDELARQLH